MHPRGLQRRADHAIQPGFFGIGCIVIDHLLQRLFDPKVFFHALLVGGSQLCDGDQQRPAAVRARQSLERGLHHRDRAARMQVAHIHIQSGKDFHGFFDRIRYVVQLQIEEDPMPSGFDLPDDLRSLGIKKLHADLDVRFFFGEPVQKAERLRRGRKITRNDHIFSHINVLLR